MRLAVLSDIHGNLTALETALADLEAAGAVDTIWVLGDLAAFGPRPAECVRRVRELIAVHGEEKVKVIGGNTDRYLVTGERPAAPPAKDEAAFQKILQTHPPRDTVINWCRAKLAWEDYEFLSGILGKEIALEVPGYGYIIGYHAIPGDDEAMLLPDTPEEQALDALLDREGRLGIGGHIHAQMDRDLGRWRVINVGSVGLSFDMPGKAQWGLFTFDGDRVSVDLRAAPYAMDAAIADLDTVGYPAKQWVLAGFFKQG
jgi:predicted phosphodiesterase